MASQGTRERSIGPERSDADVLTAAKSGERAAFADLMRRHTAIAHRTAVLLGAGPDADDVVQEAFVKAYRAAVHRPGRLAVPAVAVEDRRQ